MNILKIKEWKANQSKQFLVLLKDRKVIRASDKKAFYMEEHVKTEDGIGQIEKFIEDKIHVIVNFKDYYPETTVLVYDISKKFEINHINKLH